MKKKFRNLKVEGKIKSKPTLEQVEDVLFTIREDEVKKFYDVYKDKLILKTTDRQIKLYIDCGEYVVEVYIDGSMKFGKGDIELGQLKYSFSNAKLTQSFSKFQPKLFEKIINQYEELIEAFYKNEIVFNDFFEKFRQEYFDLGYMINSENSMVEFLTYAKREIAFDINYLEDNTIKIIKHERIKTLNIMHSNEFIKAVSNNSIDMVSIYENSSDHFTSNIAYTILDLITNVKGFTTKIGDKDFKVNRNGNLVFNKKNAEVFDLSEKLTPKEMIKLHAEVVNAVIEEQKIRPFNTLLI